jgi:uncharacterized alkaline shock family protein YloU
MTGTGQRDPRESGAVTHIHKSGRARGTVRVAPAVLIQLIELTVQGIKGIGELRSLRLHKPATAETGARTFNSGRIAVTVNGDQIDAAIAIAIHRGANVSELSNEIKRQIGFAAGNMLGMTVRTVDIYIDEIMPVPTGS